MPSSVTGIRIIGLFLIMLMPFSGYTQQSSPAAPTSTVVPTQASALPPIDVVSVTPSNTADAHFSSENVADGFVVRNAPLIILLRQAFDLMNYDEKRIVGAPNWVYTERYDIRIKIAAEDAPSFQRLSRQDRGRLLQEVLADRFHLRSHTANRMLPVFLLKVVKNGALTTASPDRIGGDFDVSRGQISARGARMPDLVNFLTQETGRTVIDQTGLSATYSFKLTWTPSDAGSQDGRDDGETPSEAPPSLLTALKEQLGMQLVSSKGPVPCFVIDSISKPDRN